MIKRLAGGLLCAALLTGHCAAQTRPLTTAMPCAAISALVAARGAIVLGTGPYTYDRYVSNAGACGIGQTTEPAFERSADSAQCFVGYRCRGRANEAGRGN
jgi:hypothetical protein